MGNWFETCAISRLPIMTDDEVKVFVLRKRMNIYEDWQCATEIDKWFQPITFAIDAYCVSEEDFAVHGDEERTAFLKNVQHGKEEGLELMFVLSDMYEEMVTELRTREGISAY